MREKIGLGIITCNAQNKFAQSSATIPSNVDCIVIVNDGEPYDPLAYPQNAVIIQHEENRGVAKSKNDALRFLFEKDCDHIFLMEDDVLIKSSDVFSKYIAASKVSGIGHLNYALQGPYNRVQNENLIWKEKNIFTAIINFFAFLFTKKRVFPRKKRNLTAKDREKLSETSTPDARLIHKYNDEVSLAFYKNCVGAFSYYSREVVEKVGFMDEAFYNAWEHVEHTYKISKAGLHTPFWWFADIADAENYLANIENCMNQSTIAKSTGWGENILKGEKHFKEKYGLTFGEISDVEKKDIDYFIKKLQERKRNLKLLIKFPTRNRPEKFFKVLDLYLSMMSNKEDYAIIVSCDSDDLTMNNPAVIQKLNSYKNLKYFFGNNKSKIQAINADLDPIPDFDIILLASDDMIPQVKGYDEIIRDKMLTFYPDLDGVLWFDDGYQSSALNTLSIMGRKYYKRFGYLYHPSYKSLWCDNEFMCIASSLNKQRYFNQVIIQHEHPDKPNCDAKYDELQTLNLTFDDRDKSVFEERKKKNFYISKDFVKETDIPLG